MNFQFIFYKELALKKIMVKNFRTSVVKYIQFFIHHFQCTREAFKRVMFS